MSKAVFMIGAGASIDAGLSDSNNLTRKIYNQIDPTRDPESRKIFGYVISKVISRRVRSGLSPFDSVNVEEVYDALERLLDRNQDVVSEFVSGWDPYISSLHGGFDKWRFRDTFQRVLRSATEGNARSGLASFTGFDIDRLAEEIQKINQPHIDEKMMRQSLLHNLTKCLVHNKLNIEYACDIISLVASRNAALVSLNYDLVMEDAASLRNIDLDYGLNDWNTKKVVLYNRKRLDKVDFLKLHGSINWFERDDNIEVKTKSDSYDLPLLVFGNANAKLRHDGPFLQLRHEFERKLLATNEFVVIGYAFADEHLNSIIRRWVVTRNRAKMIVVDPGSINNAWNAAGRNFVTENGKILRKTVDITHIKMSASKSVDAIKDALSRRASYLIDASGGNVLAPNVIE